MKLIIITLLLLSSYCSSSPSITFVNPTTDSPLTCDSIFKTLSTLSQQLLADNSALVIIKDKLVSTNNTINILKSNQTAVFNAGNLSLVSNNQSNLIQNINDLQSNVSVVENSKKNLKILI